MGDIAARFSCPSDKKRINPRKGSQPESCRHRACRTLKFLTHHRVIARSEFTSDAAISNENKISRLTLEMTVLFDSIALGDLAVETGAVADSPFLGRAVDGDETKLEPIPFVPFEVIEE